MEQVAAVTPNTLIAITPAPTSNTPAPAGFENWFASALEQIAAGKESSGTEAPEQLEQLVDGQPVPDEPSKPVAGDIPTSDVPVQKLALRFSPLPEFRADVTFQRSLTAHGFKSPAQESKPEPKDECTTEFEKDGSDLFCSEIQAPESDSQAEPRKADQLPITEAAAATPTVTLADRPAPTESELPAQAEKPEVDQATKTQQQPVALVPSRGVRTGVPARSDVAIERETSPRLERKRLKTEPRAELAAAPCPIVIANSTDTVPETKPKRSEGPIIAPAEDAIPSSLNVTRPPSPAKGEIAFTADVKPKSEQSDATTPTQQDSKEALQKLRPREVTAVPEAPITKPTAAHETRQAPVIASTASKPSSAGDVRQSEPAQKPVAPIAVPPPEDRTWSAGPALKMQIDTPDSGQVSVHVREAQGEIHVSVRSTQPAAAVELRSDLSTLVSSLDAGGFDSQMQIPDTHASVGLGMQGSNSADVSSDANPQWSDRQDDRQQQQHRQQKQNNEEDENE
jgi:hypothetical protein